MTALLSSCHDRDDDRAHDDVHAHGRGRDCGLHDASNDLDMSLLHEFLHYSIGVQIYVLGYVLVL